MLDKIIMVPFMMFMVVLFLFLGIIGLVMFAQYGMVQNQAQHIAASMGKWGGYTVSAENSMNRFADQLNLSRHKIGVETSNTSPAPWGAPVWAKITVPFDFKLGDIEVGKYNLVGLGRSTSTYLDGAYNVTYTSP